MRAQTRKAKEPKHVVKAKERKAQRKEARAERRAAKVRAWSENRPKRDDADMSIVEQAAALLYSGSGWEQVDRTGLCQSTIYRFRNGKVYEPRFRTLQMIAKANGGTLVFVKGV